MHLHDYMMEFPEGNLDYVMRCKCGDTAPSMDIAIRRMRWSYRRLLAVAVLVFGLYLGGVFGALATGRLCWLTLAAVATALWITARLR